MDMLTALQRSGGIEALARQAGLAPPDALSAARELLPALLAAFRGYSAGRDALLASLERLGGIGLAADVMAVEPAGFDRGRTLLAELSIADDMGEDAGRPTSRNACGRLCCGAGCRPRFRARWN